MAIETTTTIAGLNKLWPLGTDPRSEGDDHIRLIKTVLQTQYAGDLWYGQRITPDRWVWNDKADGTGADVATMSETGALSVKSDLVIKAQPAQSVARLVYCDPAGTVRLFVSDDQVANACLVQPQNASGVATQTLIINSAGMALSLGGAAGTVLTTGNSISTATLITDTVFPVGHIIMAWFAGQVLRNGVFAASLDNANNAQYTAGGAGAALAGSWRSHGGWFLGGSNYLYTVQRVA